MPNCGRRLLQRLDTSYGLRGDGPEPVANWYKGSRVCARSQTWKFQGEASLPTTMRDQGGPSPRRHSMIRYYSGQHRFYAGVDLHARSMFLHVLDDQGKTAFARDLPPRPDAFLDPFRPFRDGLVVGCERLFQKAIRRPFSDIHDTQMFGPAYRSLTGEPSYESSRS